MATLSVTHSFVAGTLAKASEVNQNFNDIINWSTQIAEDNLGTFAGPITWNVTTNVKSLDITSTSNIGSISLTHNSNTLQANSPLVKILDNATTQNNAGASMLQLQATGSGHAIPLIFLKTAGTGDFLKAEDSAAGEKFKIDYNGSVTTAGHLTVAGNFSLSGQVSTDLNVNNAAIISSTTRSSFNKALNSHAGASGDEIFRGFDSSGVERFRIDEAGSITIVGKVNINSLADMSTSGGSTRAVTTSFPGFTGPLALAYGRAATTDGLILDVARIEKNVNINSSGSVTSEGTLITSDLPPGVSISTSISGGDLLITLTKTSGGSFFSYFVEDWNSTSSPDSWGLKKSASIRAGLTNSTTIILPFGPFNVAYRGYLDTPVTQSYASGTIGIRANILICRLNDA